MHEPTTPKDYTLSHLRQLQESWPAVQDADVDGVHQARIVTRRIRAVLPYVAGAPEATQKYVRRIGRALGRVRELDVTDESLTTFERRVARAPLAIGLLREHIHHELDRERRRMIKALDRPPRAITNDITHIGFARITSIWRDWRHELITGVARRAEDVDAAVRRATTVYMPNRSHAARIAVKKLRYMAEFAAAAGLLRDRSVLDDTKMAQEALGELNDLHVVAKLIERFKMPAEAAEEAKMLASVVDAEIARVHEKYLRQRDRLYSVCAACRRLGSDSGAHVARMVARAIPAAGLIALPLAVSYFGRSEVRELTGAGSPHETRTARRRPAARSSRPAFRPARVSD